LIAGDDGTLADILHLDVRRLCCFCRSAKVEGTEYGAD
jgi:hypothetical protein